MKREKSTKESSRRKFVKEALASAVILSSAPHVLAESFGFTSY